MKDCKMRWHYLSWPAMERAKRDGSGARQMRRILKMSGREQEIVSFSLLMQHLQRGGLLQFFGSADSFRLEAVRAMLGKIGAAGMSDLLAQGEALLRPVLRRKLQDAAQELQGLLTEDELQQLNGLNEAYRQQEERLYYQAYCYYAG